MYKGILDFLFLRVVYSFYYAGSLVTSSNLSAETRIKFIIFTKREKCAVVVILKVVRGKLKLRSFARDRVKRLLLFTARTYLGDTD